MKGIIIEGLAGTGKSTILKLLTENAPFRKQFPLIEVWNEDLTLGELVTELKTENKPDVERIERLTTILPAIQKAIAQNKFVILERFHQSYYALMPNWKLVNEIDEKLASMEFATVMLDFPEQMIEPRCLQRPEENEDFAEAQINWYGSKSKTLEAFIASKNNRNKALTHSRLPNLIIDTAQKDWDKYTDEVIRFINH